MNPLTPTESSGPERRDGWRPLLPRPARRPFGPAFRATVLALTAAGLGAHEVLVRRPAEEVRREMAERHEQTAALRRRLAGGITSVDPASAALRGALLSSVAWHERRARSIREAAAVDLARERRADRDNHAQETRLGDWEYQLRTSQSY